MVILYSLSVIAVVLAMLQKNAGLLRAQRVYRVKIIANIEALVQYKKGVIIMGHLQLVEGYQKSVWEDKDISAIETYFHQDALINSPVRKAKGIAQLREVIQNWHIGFPNLKVHWDDFICEKDKVVVRWFAEGHHEGDFLGIPPTNKPVRYSGVTIYQLENEKVIQYWAFVDMEHIKRQLCELHD